MSPSPATRYAADFELARTDPAAFWGREAGHIRWMSEPESVLDARAAPFYSWYVGATLNTCDNCVDRHVDAGHGERVALIHDSPVTNSVTRLTYDELLVRVARFAGAIAAQGVEKGDRVIIYMPMVPEAAIAMLACARIGAVHSVVFGGFAANELAVRIDDCAPRVIVSASCGIEGQRVIAYKPLLDEAIELAAHRPVNCIILQRPQETANMTEGRDVEWRAATAASAKVTLDEAGAEAAARHLAVVDVQALLAAGAPH